MADDAQSMENMQEFMAQQQPQGPVNPLASHFRIAALHFPLPSGGRWYDEGALEMPESQEVEVYPLTGKDEILIKTPDALMNGSSTVQVVQSCIPAIKDAYGMPTVDLDAILIAIRIASYGEFMDLDTNCPECDQENNFEIDLRIVLDSIQSPEYSDPIVVGDLTIYLKPNSFREYNSHNIENFEQQRILAVAGDDSISQEQKMTMFAESFQKLTNLSVALVADAVNAIVKSDGTQVQDKAFIYEFIDNTDKKFFQAINDRISENYEFAKLKPFQATCTNIECNHEYELPLIHDYSNFFE